MEQSKSKSNKPYVERAIEVATPSGTEGPDHVLQGIEQSSLPCSGKEKNPSAYASNIVIDDQEQCALLESKLLLQDEVPLLVPEKV